MSKGRAPGEHDEVSATIADMAIGGDAVGSLEAAASVRTGHDAGEVTSYCLPLALVHP